MFCRRQTLQFILANMKQTLGKGFFYFFEKNPIFWSKKLGTSNPIFKALLHIIVA